MTSSKTKALAAIDEIVRERDDARRDAVRANEHARAMSQKVEQLLNARAYPMARMFNEATDVESFVDFRLRRYTMQVVPRVPTVCFDYSSLVRDGDPMWVVREAIDKLVKAHGDELRERLRKIAYEVAR